MMKLRACKSIWPLSPGSSFPQYLKKLLALESYGFYSWIYGHERGKQGMVIHVLQPP